MLIRLFPVLASLAVLLSSCSKVEPVALLRDYEVFFTQDETRLYTYRTLPDRDTLFVKYQSSSEDGQKYVTEYSYAKEKKMSQRKFRITEDTKLLVEDLTYDYDSSSHEYVGTLAKIKKHRNIETGKPYKNGEYVLEFTSSEIVEASAKVIETFEKDTVMLWEGKQLPALKFSTITKIRASIKYLPIIGSSYKYRGTLYYIKGIGLVKAASRSDESSFGRELLKVEIMTEPISKL